MKNTKKIFKWYSIFHYEEEQNFLREQHKKGWKFVKVTGFGTYHFEKCECEDVAYQLDYNKEGLKNKEEYLKIFEDCGWEYIQDYAGYSYFRKNVTDGVDESIFCDEESRIQMMERVLKGRFIPLLIIFCAVLIPQFVLNLTVWNNYPIAIMMGIVLLVYVIVFSILAYKYSQIKSKK